MRYPLGSVHRRLGKVALCRIVLACGALAAAAFSSPALLLSTAWAQEPAAPPPSPPRDIEFQIFDGTITKTPVLVRDFRYEGTEHQLLTTGETCEEILAQDLTFSDFLAVTRENPRLGSGHADAEAIVYGEVVSRFGKVILKGKLVDAATGNLIFESDYPLGAPPDRWAIHAFSDDVVLYLTGERGVARSRIAFVGDATGSKEVYVIDYDGARLSRVSNLGSISISPAWSRDGTEIAFTTFASGNPDLVRVKVGSPDAIAVSARPGINSAPVWHPDGRRIAAALSFEGNTEIYLMDKNGKNLERLTFQERSIETSPTFSPTGNQMCFVSDRTGQTQLYLMDSDGANVRQLVSLNGMCDSPSWSPDGDWIVFVARVDPVFDIFRVRPDGRDLVRLTADSGSYENPRWAPDSRHVVYARREGGSRKLYVMAADGSGKRQLTWSHGDQYNPAWSPPLSE